MTYLILTPEFVAKYDGYMLSPNMFVALQTNTGLFVCDKKVAEQFTIIFKEYDFEEVELTNADFVPDYSRIDLKVDEHPVYSKTENYYEKTVTIVYLIDGEKKEVIEKMENVAVTKDGYSVDLAEKIRLKEAEAVKAEVDAIDLNQIK